MVNSINVSWKKTKKNVEQLIKKYNYYNLSIDSTPLFGISDSFLLEKLSLDQMDDTYIKIDYESKKQRINFINYVRFSFNKLTTDERKIIYWTYLDKENNYDDRFIANNLGFSLGYYYIKKKETLIRFAYSLGIEENIE